jgi:tetratricopeptide (TPR) repeat protein
VNRVSSQHLDPAATVALVGAGVSVDAGLPTAWGLYDELVDSLVIHYWAAEELKRLARMPRVDAFDDHDVIRFETLLLWISDVYDEDLGFFDFLDDYKTPGPLHLRFAAAAMRGLSLLTTNFDDLLEQGILACGGRPETLDAQKPRQTMPSAIPIVKLHGTRQVHPAGIVGSRVGPLQATTERIASTSPGNLLNHHAEQYMNAQVDGQVLVVCGYSGSDDLDIVPALERMRPCAVIWIDHAGGVIRSRVPRPPRRSSLTWERLAWAWAEAGVDVTIWRGPSVDIADRLGLKSPASPLKAAGSSGLWRQRIHMWARRVHDQDPTGLGLAALLFGELGRHELAERALRESRPSSRSDGGWNEPRRKYEMAQTALLMTPTDPVRAYRLGTEALAAAEAAPESNMADLCQLLLGRAAFFQQHWDAARQHLMAAETAAPARSLQKAWAWGWLGRVETWGGNPRQSRPWLKKSIRLFRKLGELEGLTDSLHALGVTENSLGNVNAAEPLFQEAAEIARILGFIDRRFTSHQALAECAFTTGDLQRAEALVLEALHMVPRFGNDEVADAWTTIAELELQQGNMAAAIRHARRAIQTTTIINCDGTALRWALLSEIHWLAGRRRAARIAAKQARSEPSEKSTALGRARALAILFISGSGGIAIDDLNCELASANILPSRSLLTAAASLVRLQIQTREAMKIIHRAGRYAERIGSRYWAEYFELQRSLHEYDAPVRL